MTNRVVVTGLGCLTSVGHTVEDTWKNIKEGKHGIEPVTLWDTTDWEYTLGSQLKEFDPRQFIDRKLLKLLSRHDVIGLSAVDQAIKHSQLLSYRDGLADPTDFNERTGVYVASPGSKFYQQYDFFPLLTQAEGDMQRFGRDLNSVVHPMWLLRTLPNNVLAYTGIQYGFKGANQNIINHSVGGVQAILEATDAIRRGVIDRAMVVGYDSMLDPQSYTYYAALGVMSKLGAKPFDEHRDGTILGEGSGALLLETLSSAKERGATIYGEVIAGATTTEGMGIFSIRDDGDGLNRAVQETLQRAHLTPKDIGMITSHGNGTQISDMVEANVYTGLFSAQHSPVTSFKWALGHTFSAAGVIETIMTLLALQEGLVPGIHTMQQKANDCQAIAVSQSHQPIQQSTALIVNRGFASINSCLVVSSEPL